MNDSVLDVLSIDNNDFYKDNGSSGLFEIKPLNPQSALQSLLDTYSVDELSSYNLH